jgi:hypothetical protein
LFKANLGKIRDAGFSNPTNISQWQAYLHEKIRSGDSSSGHWTSGDWESLTDEFGPDVARAFRDGAVAYWPKYTSKLRSEGQRGNGTPFKVIFGLTGLAIESRETEKWASTLTEAQAHLAFRYAMEELNGFPDWMPSLYAAFSAQVSEWLLREVDYDLRIESIKSQSHYILSDLAWSGSWAWQGIGRGMFDRLAAREPRNLTNLGYMLNIVHGADIPDAEIAELAARKSLDRRLDHAARWFAVWVGVAPDAAIPAITARLESIRSTKSQVTFAMQFITNLLGGRHSETKFRAGFRTAGHLKDLYKLVHRYVREKDDIHRAGKGVYSPGLRDSAQDARSQLFSLLQEIPGKEAYLALMELAELHPEPSARPWMFQHARMKAEQDAELTPWAIKQTLEFQTSIERTPRNHRELFELAELRFLDLKQKLEHGDSSIADILIKGATLETDMRTYIGDWLRDSAQGRYSIPQEEELADAKRPDLRFQGAGFDGPVPAELKLADKWSGPDLLERLENQLCGDYLRDDRSNRGLFILVKRGEKKQWDLAEYGGKVDFEGLVIALQAHWQKLTAKFPGIDDIRVIGIDLTRRSK